MIKAMKKGSLPSQTILDLMKAGFIRGASTDNVRPSSLDLSLSAEVYEVEGIFQPRPGEKVRELLNLIRKKPFSWDKLLVPGQAYLARLNETLSLPENVYGYCNPKSTSGRIDAHVRLVADNVARYDSVTPAGWRGELWVSIIPKTFPIKIATNQTLNQLRFFNSDTRLNNLELEIAFQQYQLLWRLSGKPLSYHEIKVRDNDGSVILTLDLSGEVIGYRSKHTGEAIDLAQIKHYRSSKFFEPIKKKNGHVYLKKGEFYILSTAEAVRVPPELACEMVTMDERSGDFRSHYAGFIDPGWGWGKSGEGKGRPLTLEVRPFEDLIVRHGQPIAKIRFEHMAEVPEVVYDAISSNYIQQSGPRLSKHFK